MSIDLEDFMAKGYLPKELPPLFSSAMLAEFVAKAHPISLLGRDGRNNGPLLAVPASHNLVRPGRLRRRLHLLNPFSFYRLASCVSDHWTALEAQISRSRLSVSKPVPDPKRSRCLIPRISGMDLIQEKVRIRAAARFVLQTDIARFYPSIYTHSIPWAIEGKENAKAKRKGGLGNDLDLLIRDGQDGQTMGIPIGPDTSLVIAEAIAASVDERFMNDNLIGLRFMDDYEIACETRYEAEQSLERIERALSDFELAINPRKTRIEELPCELDSRWRRDLSDFKFGRGERASRRDVIRFFDTAFRLHREMPNEPIIAYAISRLRSVTFSESIWELCRPLICQCLLVDPASMRAVYRVLQKHKAYEHGVDVQRVLNSIIKIHSGLDHGSEVAWAVWTCIQLSISIHEDAVRAMAETRDPVVRTLALFARERGVIVGKTAMFDQWESTLSQDSLYDENWLYAYEANLRGWLKFKEDYVSRDANFSCLKSESVSFIATEKADIESEESDDNFDPYGGDGDDDDDDESEEDEQNDIDLEDDDSDDTHSLSGP